MSTTTMKIPLLCESFCAEVLWTEFYTLPYGTPQHNLTSISFFFLPLLPNNFPPLYLQLHVIFFFLLHLSFPLPAPRSTIQHQLCWHRRRNPQSQYEKQQRFILFFRCHLLERLIASWCKYVSAFCNCWCACQRWWHPRILSVSSLGLGYCMV